MARRGSKRKKKGSALGFLVRNSVRILTVSFPYIVSFGFAGILFGASYAFAIQSDLFSLSTVTIQGENTWSGPEAFRFIGVHEGEKIFDVDLGQIERRIRSKNPEYKHIRVKRILPSEITVILRKRQPIAQIYDHSYYPVDYDGVIVANMISSPINNLPVIRGKSLGKKKYVKGTEIRDDSMLQVIQMIHTLKKMGILNKNKLTSVDIGERNNYVLWMNKTVEVRMSSRNLSEQVKKLSDALLNLYLDPEKFKYLDLRFDDLVFGHRGN